MSFYIVYKGLCVRSACAVYFFYVNSWNKRDGVCVRISLYSLAMVAHFSPLCIFKNTFQSEMFELLMYIRVRAAAATAFKRFANYTVYYSTLCAAVNFIVPYIYIYIYTLLCIQMANKLYGRDVIIFVKPLLCMFKRSFESIYVILREIRGRSRKKVSKYALCEEEKTHSLSKMNH